MKKFFKLDLILLTASILLLMSSCTSKTTIVPLQPSQDKVVLDTPSNIAISGTTLTWGKVSNAAYYKLTIKDPFDNLSSTITRTTSSASYTLTGSNEVDKWIIVSITAYPENNSETYESSETATFEVVALLNKSLLSKPGNIQVVVDSVNKYNKYLYATLTWSAVENAKKYHIMYYRMEQRSDGTLQDMTATLQVKWPTTNKLNVTLIPGYTYDFAIAAIPETSYSPYIRSDFSQLIYTAKK